MANLNVKLHAKQLEVFNDKARFKVVAAGRRFGKSRLAAWILLIEALQSKEKDVFYVAPTFQQAKDIIWTMLKDLGGEVIASAHENTGVLTLINGRRIFLKGSDRPDTMRGMGLHYVVIDEYADMKSSVWEQIIRPSLADVKGGALFIGTPKGRNHFWELYQYAAEEDDPEWAAFHFTSFDNPFLAKEEIEAAKKSMSSFAFRQEFLSSFEAGGNEVFKEEWLKYDPKEPKEGGYYIAVDLAGFEDFNKQVAAKSKRLDETAIAIVKANTDGWWVKDILHGRWDVRECAVRILKAARDYQPIAVGIEKGALKNAVMPYLSDMQKRFNLFFPIQELTHGNKKKTDRIIWSLQGRFEHGRVSLNKGDWNSLFVDQLLQFPDPRTHDDLVDALSYVDQLANISFVKEVEDDYEVLDETVGF